MAKAMGHLRSLRILLEYGSDPDGDRYPNTSLPVPINTMAMMQRLLDSCGRRTSYWFRLYQRWFYLRHVKTQRMELARTVTRMTTLSIIKSTETRSPSPKSFEALFRKGRRERMRRFEISRKRRQVGLNDALRRFEPAIYNALTPQRHRTHQSPLNSIYPIFVKAAGLARPAGRVRRRWLARSYGDQRRVEQPWRPRPEEQPWPAWSPWATPPPDIDQAMEAA